MMALLLTILIAAFAVVTVAVEAMRTGRWKLGSDAADDIPDSFYGGSFLPDGLLDNMHHTDSRGIFHADDNVNGATLP